MAGTDRETDFRGEPDENGYCPLTDQGVKVLADAARTGQVFGSWALPLQNKALVQTVFMPIGLGIVKELPRPFLDSVVHVYEWVDEAAPTGVDGCPIFLSVRFLTQGDWSRLCARINAVNEAIAKLDQAEEPAQ